MTKGKIADILQTQGDLDGALRIIRDEISPALERLGDALAAAVAKAKVADILAEIGDLDGAVDRRRELLSEFERLGDARELLYGRANLALMLLQRGRDADRAEARDLLNLALTEARRLQLPEAAEIEAFIAQAGLGEG